MHCLYVNLNRLSYIFLNKVELLSENLLYIIFNLILFISCFARFGQTSNVTVIIDISTMHYRFYICVYIYKYINIYIYINMYIYREREHTHFFQEISLSQSAFCYYLICAPKGLTLPLNYFLPS